MTESELTDELLKDPFIPFRLHLVSGKTLDVLAATAAHTLNNALLVLRNPRLGSPRAEGYDLVAYHNIERIEQLDMGGRQPAKKRKRA
jgi:hypothetical protein